MNFEKPILTAETLSVNYGKAQALHNINMQIPRHSITAIIGPSGCGKSTLLRCFNRMNDNILGFTITGKLRLDEENILSGFALERLRKRVGMVFQQATPFPMSIYDNVVFGPKLHGKLSRDAQNEIVETTLKQAGLWREVKDRLHGSAQKLSGGQQQRLCIARALANQPEIILMDEPASTLDPISTGKIEELILELKSHYTIVMVTHSMQQAGRISDFTGFLLGGELVEFNTTEQLFKKPAQTLTENYITGRFG